MLRPNEVYSHIELFNHTPKLFYKAIVDYRTFF